MIVIGVAVAVAVVAYLERKIGEGKKQNEQPSSLPPKGQQRQASVRADPNQKQRQQGLSRITREQQHARTVLILNS